MRPGYELPPLDKSIKGDTSLFGWMTTINFLDMLNDFNWPIEGFLESEGPPEHKNIASTITHEGIHFIQALSASYVFRLSYLLLREVAVVIKQIQQLPSDAIIALPLQVTSSIETLLNQVNVKSKNLSTPDIPGISALDIIEGAAVFIDHRIRIPQLNNDEYLRRIEAQYSSGNLRTYSNAYRLAEWYLGEEIFDMFSVICYLALCSVNPGEAFCQYLRVLGYNGVLSTNNHLVAQEVVDLGVASGITEPKTAFHEASKTAWHPILSPYIEMLVKNLPDFSFIDFFARPYECEDVNIFKWMSPPFTRFWGGTGKVSSRLPNFFSKDPEISEEEKELDNVDFVVSLTAICGSVLAMLWPNEYHLQCQHIDCPYHRLRLCHAYIAVPPTYQECGFPERFEKNIGRSLNVVRLE